MQLHFEADEFNLLANILMQKSGKPAEGLLDMVLARNLRFDLGRPGNPRRLAGCRKTHPAGQHLAGARRPS